MSLYQEAEIKSLAENGNKVSSLFPRQYALIVCDLFRTKYQN